MCEALRLRLHGLGVQELNYVLRHKSVRIASKPQAIGLVQCHLQPCRLATRPNDRIAERCNEHVAWSTLVFPESGEVFLGNERPIAIIEMPNSDVLEAHDPHAVVDVMRTLQV